MNPELTPNPPRRDSVVALRRPECPQLFFVFRGHGHQLLLDPAYFLQATGLISRNLAMFRDNRRAFYQLGTSEQLPDWEAVLDWQREFRASLPGVERTYCVGTSAGSFAAMLSGHLLKADAVWAFGPTTRIDLDRFATRPGRERLLRLPTQQLDLAQVLADGNGKTDFRLYFSQDAPRDPGQAERIAHCPGVRLYPQPGSDHNVLMGMQEREELTDLFPAWSPPVHPNGRQGGR